MLGQKSSCNSGEDQPFLFDCYCQDNPGEGDKRGIQLEGSLDIPFALQLGDALVDEHGVCAHESGDIVQGSGLNAIIDGRAGGTRYAFVGRRQDCVIHDMDDRRRWWPGLSEHAAVCIQQTSRGLQQSGRLKKNDAPWSCSPSTQTLPPWRSTIRRTIDNPTPVPSN